MKNRSVLVFAISLSFMLFSCGRPTREPGLSKGEIAVSESQNSPILTPDEAIRELKNGNKRFMDGKLVNTNYKQQIERSKSGQKPHSAILACMDSRVPPEIVFDQGIGNIFTIRIAGNIEDENVLGSLEYAVEHSGSKLIVVLGHSHCGAITGAVEDVKLGNLTQLLDQIKPALTSGSGEDDIIERTARNNIKITINDILRKSEIIRELMNQKTIAVVGAFYNIETGEVTFME